MYARLVTTCRPFYKTDLRMAPLNLYIDLSQYGLGEFEDSQSAIARPYRRLFEDGADPGAISYLLIPSVLSSQYEILGTLCETPGQRLLFFPGCRIRELSSLFNRGSTAEAQALDGIVDHITFETSNRTRHITEILSNGARRTVLNLTKSQEMAPGLYAWFGMMLSPRALLDRVPGKLWFSMECPDSDAKRRLELFRNAANTPRISTLPIGHPTNDQFLQINFFVDFEPTQSRGQIRTFLPNGPPELQRTIEIPATMTTQLYGLPLRDSMRTLKINALLGKENQRMMLDLASKDIVAKRKDSVYKSFPQIEFTEWTPDGHLRHSKFVGLREDKDAREVMQEG
jgi:hypothetical protein